MDLKLKDFRDACEEMGLSLALKCGGHYYYSTKNCSHWILHFVGDEEQCVWLQISTEWKYVDDKFLPDSPKRLLENISKEQLKQEIKEMLIKLKKAMIQKKKNDLEQDFWEHTYTITGTY